MAQGDSVYFKNNLTWATMWPHKVNRCHIVAHAYLNSNAHHKIAAVLGIVDLSKLQRVVDHIDKEFTLFGIDQARYDSTAVLEMILIPF